MNEDEPHKLLHTEGKVPTNLVGEPCQGIDIEANNVHNPRLDIPLSDYSYVHHK